MSYERLFFPSYIRWLTNFVTLTSPYTGSGRTCLFLGFVFLIVKKIIVVWLPFTCLQRTPLNSFTQPFIYMAYPKKLLLLRASFRAFSSIFRSPLRTAIHAGSIQSSAYHVITHTGEVFHTPAPYQHDGVLLQVVPLSGNVCIYLLRVSQTYTSHLSHGGVRLFGSSCIHPHAHAATLWT